LTIYTIVMKAIILAIYAINKKSSVIFLICLIVRL